MQGIYEFTIIDLKSILLNRYFRSGFRSAPLNPFALRMEIFIPSVFSNQSNTLFLSKNITGSLALLFIDNFYKVTTMQDLLCTWNWTVNLLHPFVWLSLSPLYRPYHQEKMRYRKKIKENSRKTVTSPSIRFSYDIYHTDFSPFLIHTRNVSWFW